VLAPQFRRALAHRDRRSAAQFFSQENKGKNSRKFALKPMIPGPTPKIIRRDFTTVSHVCQRKKDIVIDVCQ
jgi:hypothetical protein